MYKFIFQISDGVSVIVEAENISQANKKFEEKKGEFSVGQKIVISQKKAISQTPRGLYHHLLELKDEDFFANPQTLGSLKKKLAEKALHYPTTTFPNYLNRLIYEKALRRFKQNIGGKEAWVYVNY